jgi:hypothetical protein
MALWTDSALANREALPNSHKNGFSSKARRVVFLLRDRAPKTWLLPAPPTFSSYTLRKKNTGGLLSNELQNGSGSSREVKELEEPKSKLFLEEPEFCQKGPN